MQTGISSPYLRNALSAIACAALVACGGGLDDSSSSTNDATDAGNRPQALARKQQVDPARETTFEAFMANEQLAVETATPPPPAESAADASGDGDLPL